MFGHHKNEEKMAAAGAAPMDAGDYRKEEKHHKHMEQIAKLGAAAAGAYAMVHIRTLCS